MSYRNRWNKHKNNANTATQKNRVIGVKHDNTLEFEQLMAALDVDLLRLSKIESHQRKDQLKKDEFLPRYREYLEKLLENDSNGQNDILIHNLIFALDAQDFEWAIKLAEFAHKKGMETPENYKRDPRNLLAGQMSSWCISQIKKDESPEPWNHTLFEMTKDWDLVDNIKAEILRAEAHTMPDSQEKLDLYQQAYELNDKVGVAPQIKALKKLLTPPEPQAPAQS